MGSGRGGRRDFLVATAFLLPNLVLLAVFAYRPLVDNIRLSFTSWNLSSPVATFIGWDNYTEWFTSPASRVVLTNTVVFTGADGRLQQVGTPTELYERPVNAFVAGFIGSPGINLLDQVPMSDGRAVLSPSVQLPVAPPSGALPASVTVGIRPEGVDVSFGDATAPGRLRARSTRVDGPERRSSPPSSRSDSPPASPSAPGRPWSGSTSDRTSARERS